MSVHNNPRNGSYSARLPHSAARSLGDRRRTRASWNSPLSQQQQQQPQSILSGFSKVSPRSGLERFHSNLFTFTSPAAAPSSSTETPVLNHIHNDNNNSNYSSNYSIFHRERFSGEINAVPVPPTFNNARQASMASSNLYKKHNMINKDKNSKNGNNFPLRHHNGSASFALSGVATSSARQLNRQLKLNQQVEKFSKLSIATKECVRCLDRTQEIEDIQAQVTMRDAKLKNMELLIRELKLKVAQVKHTDAYKQVVEELRNAQALHASKQKVIDELLQSINALVSQKDDLRKRLDKTQAELEDWKQAVVAPGSTPLSKSIATTRRNSVAALNEEALAEEHAKNEVLRMNLESQCHQLQVDIEALKARHVDDLRQAEERFERKERQAQAAEMDIEDLRRDMARAAESEAAALAVAKTEKTKAEEFAEKLEYMTKQRDTLRTEGQRDRMEYSRIKAILNEKDSKIQELLMELAARDDEVVQESKKNEQVLEEMDTANFVEQDAAIDLLHGGTLAATLSLAGSSDAATREKAKAQLQAFVKARKEQLSTDSKLTDKERKELDVKNQLFTRQLNTAATAIQLIQNWTAKVDNAKIEPEVQQEAEEMIFRAQAAVAKYQPGLGVRFQTEHGSESTQLIYIVQGSSAEAAGLKVGDLVEQVDGVSTTNQVLFKQEVARRKPGELVPFTVSRRGQLMEIKVRIGAAGKALNEVRTNLRLAECIIYRTDLIRNRHPDYMLNSEDFFCDIFLGGSCNPTTWRFDVAIPMFELEDVSFYNPQVDDWTPDLVDIESKAKDACKILLFVIDNQTRALASMLEAAEYIGVGRKVVLVIQAVEDEAVINGDVVPPNAVKDFNRARSYLRDIANRHGIPCFSKIPHAIQECVNLVKGRLDVKVRGGGSMRSGEGWNDFY